MSAPGQKMQDKGSVRGSPAHPATRPDSGCKTKEANQASRALPATPRVNKTQQVDKEPAAVPQELRRHAETLRQATVDPRIKKSASLKYGLRSTSRQV